MFYYIVSVDFTSLTRVQIVVSLTPTTKFTYFLISQEKNEGRRDLTDDVGDESRMNEDQNSKGIDYVTFRTACYYSPWLTFDFVLLYAYSHCRSELKMAVASLHLHGLRTFLPV